MREYKLQLEKRDVGSGDPSRMREMADFLSSAIENIIRRSLFGFDADPDVIMMAYIIEQSIFDLEELKG